MFKNRISRLITLILLASNCLEALGDYPWGKPKCQIECPEGTECVTKQWADPRGGWRSKTSWFQRLKKYLTFTKMYTLYFLIDKHVRLFISRQKLPMCRLILDCALIHFTWTFSWTGVEIITVWEIDSIFPLFWLSKQNFVAGAKFEKTW